MTRRKKRVARPSETPFLDSSLVTRVGGPPLAKQRRGRKSRRKNKLSSTALESLIDYVVAFAEETGYTPEQIAGELKDQERRVREGSHQVRNQSIPVYEILHHISELLQDWAREPAYTDKYGAPRPIRLKGARPSIEHLLGRRVSRTVVREVLRWLPNVALLKRMPGGLFLPSSDRSMIVGGEGELTASRIATVVGQFIGTAIHNQHAGRDPAKRNFDRVAHGRQLAAKSLPAFGQYVEEHGLEFLRGVDNWIDDHRPSAGEASMPAGVHVYLYSRAGKKVGSACRRRSGKVRHG